MFTHSHPSFSLFAPAIMLSVSVRSVFVIVVCLVFDLRLHALVRSLIRSHHFFVLLIALDKMIFILSHCVTDDRILSGFFFNTASFPFHICIIFLVHSSVDGYLLSLFSCLGFYEWHCSECGHSGGLQPSYFIVFGDRPCNGVSG